MFAENESATLAAAAEFARRLQPGHLVFLVGTLGAGKTTFARGILRALGHQGPVKSPTYTLLEPYRLAAVDVYHFDLYRIADPEELAFIGFEELLDAPAIKLVEWPERAQTWLTHPDWRVSIDLDGDGRTIRISSGQPG